jgi:hypothetical protein
MNGNPVVRAVERELKHYPGVRMELDESGGRHARLLFEKGGQSRFLTVPRSPSDFRAPKNAIRDFRKTMKELGATPLPTTRRNPRKSDRFPAYLSLNGKNLSISILKKSPLLSRFKTKDAKAVAAWTVDLVSSPDLNAPPMLSLKRKPIPDGPSHHGTVKGFHVPNTGGWRLSWGRTALSGLGALAPAISAEGLRLYKEGVDELVFQLPPSTLPTGFVARQPESEEPEADRAPLPSEAWAEPDVAPAPAKPAAPVAEAGTGLADRPIVLQFPKQPVSVEAAIAVLNRAKARLGSGLRFTIEEGGYLSAVHRIGK